VSPFVKDYLQSIRDYAHQATAIWMASSSNTVRIVFGTLFFALVGFTESHEIQVRPHEDLQAVLDASSAGDVLLLADGAYLRNTTVKINKNISIMAQNAGEVVIGDGSNCRDGPECWQDPYKCRVNATWRNLCPQFCLVCDWKRHHVFEVNGGAVILNGLNVTGGRERAAGGILITGGTVDIRSCAIYGNQGYGDWQPPDIIIPGGGGISIHGGTVNVTNSEIFSNTGKQGGGVAIKGGAVHFDSCHIHSNKGGIGGGGIYVKNAHVTAVQTEIDHNTNSQDYGGGVFLDSGSGIFQRCNIHSNQAVGSVSDPHWSGRTGEGGAVSMENSNVLFQECNIYENYANAVSGAVDVVTSRAVFDRCKIYSNHADSEGGAFRLADGPNRQSHVLLNATEIFNNSAGGPGGGGIWLVRESAGPELDPKTSVHDNKPNDCAAEIGGVVANCWHVAAQFQKAKSTAIALV